MRQSDTSDPQFFKARAIIHTPDFHHGKVSAHSLDYMPLDPAENTAIIMESARQRLGYNPATAVLNSFSIRVARQMVIVPGCELPPLSVTYGKGVPHVQNESWNILDIKFHVSGQMRNWKVLVVRDGMEVLSFKGLWDERLINFIKAFNNKWKEQRDGHRQRAASDPCHGPAAVGQG